MLELDATNPYLPSSNTTDPSGLSPPRAGDGHGGAKFVDSGGSAGLKEKRRGEQLSDSEWKLVGFLGLRFSGWSNFF